MKANQNNIRMNSLDNVKAIPNEMTELTGPQCYHHDDYSIFYNNIKDNVAKRIATCFILSLGNTQSIERT